MNTTSIPRDAVKLWKFIVKHGGLDLQRYDEAIVTELMTELNQMGKSGAGSLEKQLKDGAVSVEELLAAFFRTIEPYATMMAELLKFFEEAGAKCGKDNLRVEFDFSVSERLGLDLKHFREYTQRWIEVQGRWAINAWESKDLWKLNDALRREGGVGHPILK